MAQQQQQQLGGGRQSSPLEDEMSYPLTQDEFLTIKENLIHDKFTNAESFLLSTFFTALISGIVIWYSGSFYKKNASGGEVEINVELIVTLIIYGAITFGTLLCFIISLFTKKKNKSSIQRLEAKINNHLERQNL
uniref:hypothetical protein n=1 Tax=Flavobacterium sp. TaxID=239 RepID=UPI00404A3F7F